jgi:hypothetical protein
VMAARAAPAVRARVLMRGTVDPLRTGPQPFSNFVARVVIYGVAGRRRQI